MFAHEVEYEHGVDHPDRGGEVRTAVVRERVASGAGALPDRAGDPDLQRLVLRARGERVEFLLEVRGLAAEDPGQGGLVAQVNACLLDLLVAVEHRPVVDPHRVGVLVLDDRAVDERAEVLDGLVVELGAGDPLRDRLGELRRDLVHVGELVGHCRRQLVGDWPLGHALADPVGQGELAAEVVGFFGDSSSFGGDFGDSRAVGSLI